MISRPALFLLVAGAAAAGIWIGWKTHDKPGAQHAADPRPPASPVRFLDEPVSLAADPADASSETNLNEPNLAASDEGRSGPATGASTAFMALHRADLAMPTREELEFRAFKVEQLANKELQNLLRVLELDEAEQDRVFAALARKSSYFHPSLHLQNLAGGELKAPDIPITERAPTTPPNESLLAARDSGTTPPDGSDPVIDALPRELVPRYRDYKSEREAFWAGVVEKIESQLEKSATGN
jgi:hypothetical protein